MSFEINVSVSVFFCLNAESWFRTPLIIGSFNSRSSETGTLKGFPSRGPSIIRVITVDVFYLNADTILNECDILSQGPRERLRIFSFFHRMDKNCTLTETSLRPMRGKISSLKPEKVKAMKF